jgi:hypothetical protein
LREIFQCTLENSEQLVNHVTTKLPLMLTLIFGNSCMIG